MPEKSLRSGISKLTYAEQKDVWDYQIARARIASLLYAIKLRDSTVRAAYAIGFSKSEIHKETGLARTTINRILKGQ